MKLRVTILSIVFAMFSALPIFAAQNIGRVYATTPDNYVTITGDSTDHFILSEDGESVYEVSETLGTTTGYGSILKGSKISISSTSNGGYYLVGYRVEVGGVSKIYTSSDEDFTLDIIDTILDDDIYPEKATLSSINGLTENVRIDALYRQIFYNIDVASFSAKLNLLEATNYVEIDELADIVAYDEVTPVGEVIRYSNAIIRKDKRCSFVETLYKKGNKFYTLQTFKDKNNLDVEQEIDWSRGTYGNGANASVSLNFAKPIDLHGVSVTANSSSIVVSNLNISKNETTKISEGATFEFEVAPSGNSTGVGFNEIAIDATDLFKVTLVVKSKVGENTGVVTGDELTNLLGCINIQHEFSKISNTEYYVARDESLIIKCVNCGKTVDGIIYSYYSFHTMAGITTSEQAFSFTSNNTIEIVYTSTLYEVQFVPIIRYNAVNYETQEEFTDFPENLFLARNQEMTIEEYTATNIGYSFVGYSLTPSGEASNSVDIAIDDDKPAGIKVYVIFAYKEYTLKIGSVNSTTISGHYATDRLNVINDVINFSFDTTNDRTTTEYSQVDAFKIGDTLSFSADVNAGFSVKFKFGGEDITSLTLTKDKLVEVETNSNILELSLEEETIKYTLNYYINPAYDVNGIENNSTIMADISYSSIAKNEATYNVVYVDKNGKEEGETGYDASATSRIVIDNVSLYDQIKLMAKTKTVGEAPDMYKFEFSKFINMLRPGVSLAYADDTFDSETKIVTLDVGTGVISKDGSIDIQVLYTNATGQITISYNKSALNFDGVNFADYITLSAGGTNVPVDGSSDTSHLVYYTQSNNVSLVFKTLDNLNANLGIKMGYLFTGYSVNGTVFEKDAMTFADHEYSNDINITSTTEIQLLFELITYRLEITQNGGGDANGTTINKEFTVSDKDNIIINFGLPEGHYISNAYIKDHEEAVLNAFLGTNGLVESEFNKNIYDNLAVMEGFGVFSNGGRECSVTICVNYSIHVFEIRVNFAMNEPTNKAIVYPSATITKGAVSEKIDSDNEKIVFNVNYGDTAQVRINGDYAIGIVPMGWYNSLNSGLLLNSDTYTFNLVKVNQELYYRFSLAEYKMQFVNTDGKLYEKGDPKLYINSLSADSGSVWTLYDTFRIESNPRVTLGYTFGKIKIAKYTYSSWEYDELEWATKYDELYLRNNNGYYLNTDAEYDSSAEYFERDCGLEEIDEKTLNNVLFNPSYYEIVTINGENYINIEITFGLLELTIKNNFVGSRGLNVLKMDGTDLDVELKNYAQIILYKFNSDTKQYEQISPDSKLTNADIIRILVRFNVITLENNVSYNIGRGISISEISIMNSVILKNLNLNNTAGEIYYTINSVNLATTLAGLSEGDKTRVANSGELELTYTYYANKFSVEFDTNIGKPNVANDIVTLKVSKADSGESENDTTWSITSTDFFLHKMDLSFRWRANASQNNNNYFDISSRRSLPAFLAYNRDGQLIAESEYDYYGIFATYEGSALVGISVRPVEDIRISLTIQPNLTYNGATIEDGRYIYDKIFNPGSDGYGIAQPLTFGNTTQEIVSSNIVFGTNNYYVKYNEVNSNFNILSEDVEPINVGIYQVVITFNNDKFTWLNDLTINDIYLRITPKDLILGYDSSALENMRYTDNADHYIIKRYDGTAKISAGQFAKYLVFSTTDGFSLAYVNTGNDRFVLGQNYTAVITTVQNGSDTATSDATPDGQTYNVTMESIQLVNNNFNKNYNLKTNKITLENCVYIEKLAVTIDGFAFYDKVDDDTLEIEFNQDSSIHIFGLLPDDDVSVDITKLTYKLVDKAYGETSLVGTRDVELKAKETADGISDILSGAQSKNYCVSSYELARKPIVYPYILSTEVKDFGTISIYNERGRTEKDKVSLIPLGARLKVELVYPDSEEYRDTFKYFSQYLSRSKTYYVGYKLSLETASGEKSIPNTLFVTLPYNTDMVNVISLKGEVASLVEYEIKDDGIHMDMANLRTDVGTLIIVQQHTLMKWWQIVLIVSFSLAGVGAVVVALLIIRKKKLLKYSLNDKI